MVSIRGFNRLQYTLILVVTKFELCFVVSGLGKR